MAGHAMTRREPILTLDSVADNLYPVPGAPSGRVKASPLVKALLIVGGMLATVLVLCCGSGLVIGALSGPAKPKSASTVRVNPPTQSDKATPTAAQTVATPTVAATTAVPAPPPVATTAAPNPEGTTDGPPPPPPTTAAGPEPVHGVHPGAFCSPYGALGYTVDGTLMRCEPSATDSRNRWRKA